jgi:hypothetical protein
MYKNSWCNGGNWVFGLCACFPWDECSVAYENVHWQIRPAAVKGVEVEGECIPTGQRCEAPSDCCSGFCDNTYCSNVNPTSENPTINVEVDSYYQLCMDSEINTISIRGYPIGPGDWDCDGVPNGFDLDIDNDGIPNSEDKVELTDYVLSPEDEAWLETIEEEPIFDDEGITMQEYYIWYNTQVAENVPDPSDPVILSAGEVEGFWSGLNYDEEEEDPTSYPDSSITEDDEVVNDEQTGCYCKVTDMYEYWSPTCLC